MTDCPVVKCVDKMFSTDDLITAKDKDKDEEDQHKVSCNKDIPAQLERCTVITEKPKR